MADERERFRLRIKDIFFLEGGRTVFVGSVDGGENVNIKPGLCDLFVEGKKVATVEVYEEIPQRMKPLERHDMRAVSTRNPIDLTREQVLATQCHLEGPMSFAGHRHLLGIDSPPADYVPDNMTLGPRLPEGWDGDAWTHPAGDGYFLRAWHKASGRYALGKGAKYEEARRILLNDIQTGHKKVVIQVTEQV